MDDTDNQPRLDGWKEIAQYLGRSVRSVQRWEATMGLPVRRVRSDDGQTVYAHRHELDEWLRTRDTRDDKIDEPEEPEPRSPEVPEAVRPWWRRRTAFLVAALPLLAAAILAAVSFSRSAKPAMTVQWNGHAIDGVAADGTVVWSHRFDRNVSPARDFAARLDLDGDGELEFVVGARFDHSSRLASSSSDAILCFSLNGTLKWQVTPDHRLTFGTEAFTAPWVLQDIIIADSQTPRRVWAAFSHHTWWPGMVIEITPDGQQRLQYVQAGRVNALEHWVTPGGRFVVAAGVGHDPQRPMVALLAENAPPSSFTLSSDPRYRCVGCPTQPPRKVFVFDEMDLKFANPNRIPTADDVSIAGTDLIVRVLEGGSQAAPGYSIARFSADFQLQDLRPADSYWVSHEAFRRRGLLDHDHDACPEHTRHRMVREWSPDLGWLESLLPPPGL